MVSLRLRQIQIMPLAIPMRLRFEHAAASRNVADPVVVRLQAEAPYADLVGYGETLARPYVTGETAESVVEDLAGFFAPLVVDLRAENIEEALERADQLPYFVDGRMVHAARTALELAWLDLAGKVFRRNLGQLLEVMSLPGFSSPGVRSEARYSGIVVGRRPGKLRRLLRLQTWYGLRDFKLKVAVDDWEQKLEAAYEVLAERLADGRCTLRVDANGGWAMPEVLQAMPLLQRCGVTAIEQPLARRDDEWLPTLVEQMPLDIVADESLLSFEDAQRLLDAGVQVFNVRIAKHGGLLPALRIAHRALVSGADVQLGCLVGETSILTAAGIALLEICPRIRFVEGAFGPLLLKRDVTRKSLRFGYGGRIGKLSEGGLGIEVVDRKLERVLAQPAVKVNF